MICKYPTLLIFLITFQVFGNESLAYKPSDREINNSIEYPEKKSYLSSTCYYIEDPIAVILKDNPERTSDSLKNFDRIFLENMSDAIIKDDKLFDYNGKIYDRRSAKNLSPEEALKILPPKKAIEFSHNLTSNDPRFITAQIVTMINRDQSFIYKSVLFDKAGIALKPENIIAEEMSKKTGAVYVESSYAGMDKDFITARALSLQNNRPRFKFKNQIYDSQTGRNLISPSRGDNLIQFIKNEKERRVLYQSFSDKEIIINYHLDNPIKNGCQYYAIIDKQEAKISVYNLSGVRVFDEEVLVGIKNSDEKNKWIQYNDSEQKASGTTGAGIFKVSLNEGNYYNKYNINNINNNLLFEDQQVFAISDIQNNFKKSINAFGTGNPKDRRITDGRVVMRQLDFFALVKFIEPTCLVYVLPEEKNNKLIIKDGKIEFISKNNSINNNDYNYTRDEVVYKSIKIIITNKTGETEDSLLFVKALADEKSKLMKLFNLNNDDYNDLAALSYGLMGNESNFGDNKKYWIKENVQSAVVFAKAAEQLWNGNNPFDNSVLNTSRGFTQIKNLPEGAWREAYPEINKDTLGDPHNSAVSTIAYLVEAMRTLKNIANKNTYDKRKVRITKENLVDYLGYIYQGRANALKSAENPANADFNTYIQKLRKNMSYIEIIQTI